VADRIVVLDRGTVAGQFMKNDVSLQELIDRLQKVAQTGHLDTRPTRSGTAHAPARTVALRGRRRG